MRELLIEVFAAMKGNRMRIALTGFSIGWGIFILIVLISSGRGLINGMYYNLGEVGGTIWNILESPISVNALVDKLTSEYDVSREKCLEDTIPFLNALLRNKLIAEAE